MATEEANIDIDLQIKLLMLGDSQVGKTCLIARYTNNNFDFSSVVYITTLGVDFKNKIVDIEGTIVKLSIWDTAGQERFRSITNSYCRGAHGVMLVYDITDRETFTNVTHWITVIQEHADAGINIVLVGNKCDLDDYGQRQVSYQEGQDLANQFQLQFFETSAKNDTRVTEAYIHLATEAKNRLQTQRTSHTVTEVSSISVQLDQSTGKKKSKCPCS